MSLRFLDHIGRAAPQPLHHALKMSGQMPLLWLGYRRRQRLRSSSEKELQPDYPNPLCAYFDEVREGPGILKWLHYFTGEFSGFVSYLNGFVHKLNAYHLKAARESYERYLTSEASELQSHVRAVSFYPFIAVVEKRERPLTEFVTQKHGTSWEW